MDRTFRKLGILVTASEEARQEVEVSVNADIANLCGHGANHFSYGVIEAGIDFSAIDERDIEPPELGISDSYTIQLPHSESQAAASAAASNTSSNMMDHSRFAAQIGTLCDGWRNTGQWRISSLPQKKTASLRAQKRKRAMSLQILSGD
ncbi:MAG: DUF4230 domain-containing protein [Chloroflexi bacterium]|nr:DUF4230 domain-containing protein [Chloroflexota bacterium]MCY3581003.1 DUF4230 domain-containing protein [Chloroflexota bacterium]MCY3716632.1 DUF4230 domain-containing protein [Chloroflexota bacterium]MDE2650495.1 DUF4230 domain-containing protein [Chloroflexota bacterium]MYD37654.1 hypothetical protein [Chloroflexota bacterium]